MAVTQAQIDELEAALATGAKTVTYGDPPKTVTFHSLPEAFEHLQRMKDELSGSSTDRYSRATHSRS